MLPRTHRLSPKEKPSKAIFRTTLHLRLKIWFSAPDGPKASIVVGKRIDQHATGRNRLRRLLQDEIHQNLSRLPSALRLLIVVQRTPVDEGLFRQELVSELKKLYSPHLREYNRKGEN